MVALFHGRQHVIRVILHHVVHAFLVHGHVSRLDERGPVGTQHGAFHRGAGARALLVRPGQQFHGHRVEYGRRHLAGHRALPDQGVQPELIGVEIVLDVGRYDLRRCGSDGLVCLLGILRFGLEYPDFIGKPVLAIQLDDGAAHLGNGFLRQVERIGAHVGDEPDLAVADVHAFVQLLSGAHGLLRAEREFAGGFLLQGRRGERGGRIAAPLLAVDLENREHTLGGLAQRALHFVGLFRGGEAENCSTLAPSYSTSLPGNFWPECSSSASMVQYSQATNAAISSSRSQIMRSAGLCTRPADKPGRTFFHNRGDRLNPTRKSSARRACCAFTRSTDNSRGWAMASRTAFLVIS